MAAKSRYSWTLGIDIPSQADLEVQCPKCGRDTNIDIDPSNSEPQLMQCTECKAYFNITIDAPYEPEIDITGIIELVEENHVLADTSTPSLPFTG